ncbi:MAG: hypothetical protein ACLTGO_09040 [Bifidobacterium scardovii]
MPDQLASAANPYDIATRDRLLSGGVTPIYWDYAFHGGHWYSYFGVLPALLLFLPYRAVTSLFTDGGLSLPTGAAELLLMFGFLVFGCLLIIRLVQRLTAQASLAGTSMLLVFFLLATNSSYLWFRTNFYSIPIAASLLLTCLGLWLWLGAVRRLRTDAQTLDWSIDGAAPCRCRIWPAARCASPRISDAARRSRWRRCWASRCSGRRSQACARS